MSSKIDDFRNFFKPNKKVESFNPNDVINNAIGLVELSFKSHDITIIKDLSVENLKVVGYPNEFLQVIINILNNAKDEYLELESTTDLNIMIKTKLEENKVIIEIEDSAGGIDKDIIEKVFDPYFTTKEEGKGTGIGLYMTKMIVENNMHGKVFVKNTNNGCIFTISLLSN